VLAEWITQSRERIGVSYGARADGEYVQNVYEVTEAHSQTGEKRQRTEYGSIVILRDLQKEDGWNTEY
jgi:hypothetical protein